MFTDRESVGVECYPVLCPRLLTVLAHEIMTVQIDPVVNRDHDRHGNTTEENFIDNHELHYSANTIVIGITRQKEYDKHK